MRKIFTKKINCKEYSIFNNEYQINIFNINHPNLLKILSIKTNIKDKLPRIRTHICNLGSIDDYLIKNNFSYQLLNQLILETLAGINYLHQNDWVHSDFKLSNVLMNKNLTRIHFYISDLLTMKKENEVFKKTGGFYTPEIISPEVYIDQKINRKMDIWALGILLFILFTKKYPFGDRRYISLQELESNIIHYKINYDALSAIPEPYQSFIKTCLEPNPLNRPSAKELLESIEE